MRHIAAVVVLLAACYVPGDYSTLTTEFVGSRVQVGCIEIAVALTEDETAPPPIVSYQFGNGCLHQTQIDLSQIRVTGVTADHTTVELRAHDPRHELRSMRLDALTSGDERIAYDGAPSALQEVCVDFGRLDPNAPIDNATRCMSASSESLR
jgi:hypothetical protein